MSSNANPTQPDGTAIKSKAPLYFLWALTTAVTLVLDRVAQLAIEMAKYQMDAMGMKSLPLMTACVFLCGGYLWMAWILTALLAGWAIAKKVFETALVFTLCQAIFFVLIYSLVAWGLMIPFMAVDSGLKRT